MGYSISAGPAARILNMQNAGTSGGWIQTIYEELAEMK